MNLNQVTAPSTDIRRSIDFYQRLGLVLIVEELPSYARFECPEGDATFSLHQTSQPPGRIRQAFLVFEASNISLAARRMRLRYDLFGTDLLTVRIDLDG
jgi:catechol 2,3-dioxygenase-like lactoylglutathione lyase family enzyme